MSFTRRQVLAGLAGLGILWLPEYMAKAQRASGALLPLFEDWQLAPMPLYVAYPPQRHVSAKVRVFIDFLVAHVGSEPYWDREEASCAEERSPSGEGG